MAISSFNDLFNCTCDRLWSIVKEFVPSSWILINFTIIFLVYLNLGVCYIIIYFQLLDLISNQVHHDGVTGILTTNSSMFDRVRR